MVDRSGSGEDSEGRERERTGKEEWKKRGRREGERKIVEGRGTEGGKKTGR